MEVRTYPARVWRYQGIALVSGSEAAVVDPGMFPDEIEAMKADLADHTVTTVVITHSHQDHIRGWNSFPGAEVISPQAVVDRPRMSRERILAAVARMNQSRGVEGAPDLAYPEPDRTFAEETSFPLGGNDVFCRFLPGHSICTSVVWIPCIRTVLTADYLVEPGTPYCHHDAAQHLDALDRLERMVDEEGCTRAVPAHNGTREGADGVRAAIRADRQALLDLKDALDAHANLPEGPRVARAVREARPGAVRRQDRENAERILHAQAAGLL